MTRLRTLLYSGAVIKVDGEYVGFASDGVLSFFFQIGKNMIYCCDDCAYVETEPEGDWNGSTWRTSPIHCPQCGGDMYWEKQGGKHDAR